MEAQGKIKSLIESARQESTRLQPFYYDDDVFALDISLQAGINLVTCQIRNGVWKLSTGGISIN